MFNSASDHEGSGHSLFGQIAGEFSDRLARGERPEIEEYLSRYPQCAEWIRDVFPMLQAMQDQPVDTTVAAKPRQTWTELADDETLGDFRVVREIGRGGMGIVYEAEQRSLGRRVALKILPLAGLADDRRLKRFQNEVRAVATLSHPNIVSIYGVGQENGLHYYAMQLIQGKSLATVIQLLRRQAPSDQRPLDERSLVDSLTSPTDSNRERTTEESVDPLEERGDRVEPTASPPSASSEVGPATAVRLRGYLRSAARMIADVAGALEHAHRLGIVHRDIKPANLLLSTDGVVSITDFGVARVGDDKGLSLPSELLGTLRYMAPEQARGRGVVDHRADIYSLGATLYELITLQPVFTAVDRERLLHQVLAEEPVLPRKIDRQVPKDLQTIALKALAKESADRYDSAEEFRADLLRFLDDRPIQAVPAGPLTRLGKLVRRHAVAVAACALLSIVGTAISSWQALRATSAEANARQLLVSESQQRKLADQSAAAAKAANEEAQKRLAQVTKADEILGSIFSSLDPNEIARNERPLQTIIVEKLDEAVQQLDGESIGDPLVVARLQNTFAKSLLGLAEPAKAIVLLTKARDTIAAELGPEHPETLSARNNLALAYLDAGKLDQALALAEETLKLSQTRLGADDPLTLSHMNTLAGVYRTAGKLESAVPLFEKALELTKARLGPGHLDTLNRMNNLGLAYLDARQWERALPLLEDALKRQRAKLGPADPATLTTVNNLALVYQAQGRLDEALPLLEDTLKLLRATLGPRHAFTLKSMHNLATAYRAVGKLELALPLLEETVEQKKMKFGAASASTLASMSALAHAYLDAQQYDAALPLLEETVAGRKVILGPEHPETLDNLNVLAMAYALVGKVDLAIPLVEETLKIRTAKLGRDAPDTVENMNYLALCCRDAGKLDLARPLFDEVLQHKKARFGPQSPEVAEQLRLYGYSLLKAGESGEAEPLLRESLAILERQEPDAWNTFDTQSILGTALLRQQKLAEAEPLLLTGYEGLKQREKLIPPESSNRIPEALKHLVELYTALDKPAEAAKWQALWQDATKAAAGR